MAPSVDVNTLIDIPTISNIEGLGCRMPLDGGMGIIRPCRYRPATPIESAVPEIRDPGRRIRHNVNTIVGQQSQSKVPKDRHLVSTTMPSKEGICRMRATVGRSVVY